MRFRLARRNSGAGGISVIVNFACRENWTVNLQPGGWTRIVTNLVGKALKYTPKGNISIRLEVEKSELNSSDVESCPIQLIIEDTGVGISPQFLSNDLYTPFKQEDSHSIGTGLGLSIVKQIAKDMNMDLNITSELGQGTKVVLKFKAQFVPFTSSNDGRASATTYSEQKDLRGLGVKRFHVLTAQPSLPHIGQSVIPNVGGGIVGTAGDWLDCETSYGPTLPSTSHTDTVYAMMEADWIKRSSEKTDALTATLSKLVESETCVLVLAGSIRSTQLSTSLDTPKPQSVFVQQP